MNIKASAFDAQVSSLTASTVVHLDFPTYLPEAFWECGRTHLAAVRDYARSRRCAPDALLGALLVRAGASQPVAVHVDTGVKSLTPLTLFGGLAGPSGGGKTTANDLARELTLTDDDFGEL